MIPIPRSPRLHPPAAKIIGIGGAGCRLFHRLAQDGFDPSAMVAIHTDSKILSACAAGSRLEIGQHIAQGIGCAGNPDLGYKSAQKAAEEISATFGDAEIILIYAGLGGGTGSGATALITHLARNSGATVIVLCTLPFSFEGERRRAQAAEALREIESQADLLLSFENDRIGETLPPTTSADEAFAAADHLLSQCLRSLIALVSGKGIIPAGLDTLNAVLRKQTAPCLFGYGESDGVNRAQYALERAIQSPLMNRARMLAEASEVIIHIAGGNELTLGEITSLMADFNRHIGEHALIHFSLTTDSHLGQHLAVTVIASCTHAANAPAAKISRPHIEEKSLPLPGSDELPNMAEIKFAPKTGRAEQMPLEPVNRGRFEKTAATIVDGQDLDVPTFLRIKNRKSHP